MSLSILIAAYNSTDFIEKCLDSIENQTYFVNNDNFEVLLGIDNCLKTLKKVNEIKHKYRNLRVFFFNINVGTYIVANTLLQLTNHNFLYNLRFDSDDFMSPEMVSKLLENPSDFTRFRFVRTNGIESRGYAVGQHFYNKKILQKLGGYHHYRCDCDLDFVKRVRKARINTNYLSDVLFVKSMHNKQITAQKETNNISDYRNNVREICNSYSQKQLYVSKKTAQCFDLSEIEQAFYNTHGYKLNIADPKTYNEKLFYRKYFQKNSLFPQLTDKIEVRKYVKEFAPETPIIYADTYNNFNEIKFLTDCVVKANHGSGWHFFFVDGEFFDKKWNKISEQTAQKMADGWLTKFYCNDNNFRYQWAYGEIKPRLIVEEFVGKHTLTDIKFHCFDGEIVMIKHYKDRHAKPKVRVYNESWEIVEGLDKFGFYNWYTENEPEPYGFAEMKSIAQKLSKGIDYCRVDFLHKGDAFYFGEITLYNANGREVIKPYRFEQLWGEKWKLDATIVEQNEADKYTIDLPEMVKKNEVYKIYIHK
jgi:glycosyltransferase involved in cell wall biosynthesis